MHVHVAIASAVTTTCDEQTGVGGHVQSHRFDPRASANDKTIGSPIPHQLRRFLGSVAIESVLVPQEGCQANARPVWRARCKFQSGADRRMLDFEPRTVGQRPWHQFLGAVLGAHFPGAHFAIASPFGAALGAHLPIALGAHFDPHLAISALGAHFPGDAGISAAATGSAIVAAVSAARETSLKEAFIEISDNS